MALKLARSGGNGKAADGTSKGIRLFA